MLFFQKKTLLNNGKKMNSILKIEKNSSLLTPHSSFKTQKEF